MGEIDWRPYTHEIIRLYGAHPADIDAKSLQIILRGLAARDELMLLKNVSRREADEEMDRRRLASTKRYAIEQIKRHDDSEDPAQRQLLYDRGLTYPEINRLQEKRNAERARREAAERQARRRRRSAGGGFPERASRAGF